MPRRQGNIVRTTISLPAELHDLMQQIEDVNWSGVAANAFAEVIRKHGRGEYQVLTLKSLDERLRKLESVVGVKEL